MLLIKFYYGYSANSLYNLFRFIVNDISSLPIMDHNSVSFGKELFEMISDLGL